MAFRRRNRTNTDKKKQRTDTSCTAKFSFFYRSVGFSIRFVNFFFLVSPKITLVFLFGCRSIPVFVCVCCVFFLSCRLFAVFALSHKANTYNRPLFRIFCKLHSKNSPMRLSREKNDARMGGLCRVELNAYSQTIKIPRFRSR